MHVGLVIYGSLDGTSGGFRYDRKLVSHLEAAGDIVDVIELPWRSFHRGLADACSPSIRSRLDRSYDVLLQDELCHPSLWYHNPRLERPASIVALIHHLRSDDLSPVGTAYSRPVERRYLETVDATVSTSEFTHERASELASLPDRSLVAPPAGRAEGMAVSPGAVEQRARSGPLRILFVGNLVPRKDPDSLLAAVGLLPADVEWELTVVGSETAAPSYARSIHRRAERLGLDDRVTFTGECSDRALLEQFERSHVCCVPSRYEAFGMVYLEAMEYGVVPIASAVGGAREFVDDDRSGFLLEPGKPRRLARLLRWLATDRDRLADLGTNALEAATAHPSWSETMATLRAFLAAAAESR